MNRVQAQRAIDRWNGANRSGAAVLYFPGAISDHSVPDVAAGPAYLDYNGQPVITLEDQTVSLLRVRAVAAVQSLRRGPALVNPRLTQPWELLPPEWADLYGALPYNVPVSAAQAATLCPEWPRSQGQLAHALRRLVEHGLLFRPSRGMFLRKPPSENSLHEEASR